MEKPKCYYGFAFNLSAWDDRRAKYIKQLQDRGHDDSETWSLDFTIAAFILPRLINFKNIASEVVDIDYHDGFREALDVMIEGFDLMLNEDYAEFEQTEEYQNKVSAAWEALSKWHSYLWW